MFNDLITSWFSVVFFIVIGVYLLRSKIIDKSGSLAGRISDYMGGIGMIIFAISLAIAKILGKV